MNSIQTPIELLAASGDTVESYSQRVAEYFRQEREHFQAIIRMLADALAEVSGPSVAGTRLGEVAKEVYMAPELDHLQALRESIESCLTSLRRSGPPNAGPAEARIPSAVAWEARSRETYVAVFRLQRAEMIASRFGRIVLREMLHVVNTNLKQVLSPGDRLERWRDIALVAFIRTNMGLQAVRGQFSKVVSNVRLQHINVGNRSALLSIGLDWTVLPQSGPQHPLSAEVEAFLAGDTQKVSWSGA